jgi:hypothetical protein
MGGQKSAWGVWNNKPAAPAAELKSGDRECCICYNAPEEIKFAPCKHGACRPCVEDLRRYNVLRVKVPSCG